MFRSPEDIIFGGATAINQEGVYFYHKVFAECEKQGVLPFVTLHHFDTPKRLFDQGDFLNRDTMDAFVAYAKFCFDEFPEVRYWSTFNEIYPVASNQYLLDVFPPGIRFDLGSTIQCLHNMMVAHARVINIFKDNNYPGEIGVVHSLELKYPASDSEADKHAAFLDDALSVRFLLDATYLGHYSEETMQALKEICAANDASYTFLDEDFAEMEKASHRNDYLGINHYQCHFVKAYDGESQVHHNGTGDKRR